MSRATNVNGVPARSSGMAERVARMGQDESGLMPDAEFSQGASAAAKAEFEQERQRARSARPTAGAARSGRRSASSRGKKSNRKVVRSRPATPPQAAWASDPVKSASMLGKSMPYDRSRMLEMNGRARTRDTSHSGFVGSSYRSVGAVGGQHGSGTTPRMGGTTRLNHGGLMMQPARAAYVPPPPRLSPAVLASAQELMDRRAGDGTSRGMSSREHARASRSYRETMAMLIQGVMAEPPRELQESPVAIRTPREQKLTNDDLLSRNLMSGKSSSMLPGNGRVDPVDEIMMLAGAGRARPRPMDMYEA